MVNFKNIIIEAAQPAVSTIVEIQRDFINGVGEIKYKDGLDVEEGLLKSPATIGDERSQAIYVEHFNRAFGVENIYYKNEEDVGNAEALANAARKDTAKYRIAIDPIDGTGNYSGSKQEKDKRAPVNRSLDELTAEELAGGAVRPGWGSMVTIQERQSDGAFKTVASAIYESNSQDAPKNLKGKLYFSETGKQGVEVIDLQSGKELNVIMAASKEAPKVYVEGGFIKTPEAKTALANTKKMLSDEGNAFLDLSCVAQSALAVITGKAEGFFQGHPNLHDVLPVAHLADNAGLFTMVLDQYDGKPAVTKGDEVKYPIFMATTPEQTIAMAEQYIRASNFDKDKLTVRNGDWEAKGFEQLKSDMLTRAGKSVSGTGELAHQPEVDRHVG